MTTKNLNMNNIYWGLTTRVKVEVGLQNNLIEYPEYPEIIWFPQGVFIITDFKTSNQVNNYTITLSGKDKMCLLNGDVGGNFNAETDCGTIDWQDEDGVWHLKDPLPIPQVIYSLVREYAQEPDNNIIIKDIEKGLEILRNNSKNNIYIIEDIETRQYLSIFYKESLDTSSTSGTTLADEIEDESFQESYIQHTIIKNTNGEYDFIEDRTYYFGDPDTLDEEYSYINENDEEIILKANTEVDFNILDQVKDFIFKTTTNEDDIGLVLGDPYEKASKIYYLDNNSIMHGCIVIRIEPQEDIGYKTLNIVYPDELIAAPGETVVSILDKIVKAFGVYEYFYDIDGRFVFQAKETYVNTAWNAIVKRDDETFIDPSQVNKYVQYNFEGSRLTTAYQNSPQMGNIKNDYTVWGKKKNATSHEVPIHMRYAIDLKPAFYRNFNGDVYITEEGEKLWNSEVANFQAPYRKHSLPETLQQQNPNAWWHIKDWYDYYYDITGEFPNLSLQHYQAETAKGFTGRLLFPNTTDPKYIVEVVSEKPSPEEMQPNVTYLTGKPIFIFDMLGDYPYHYESSTEAFMHRFGICGHSLAWFLQKAEEGIDSYMYEPFIPDANKKDISRDLINGTARKVDWREIIYQMAKDYYKHHLEDDYAIKLRRNNYIPSQNIDLFPYGKTGYEQYYHDIEAFWRSLYFPEFLEEFNDTSSRIFQNQYAFDVRDFNEYYTSESVQLIDNVRNGKVAPSVYLYWNKKVFTDPATLYFWFDFFNAEALGLGPFSVPAIGTRPKVINNDKVKAIIYKGIPNIIFSANEAEYIDAEHNFPGYEHFQLGTRKNGEPGLVTYVKQHTVLQSGIDTSYRYVEVVDQAEPTPNTTYYILDTNEKTYIAVSITEFAPGVRYFTRENTTTTQQSFYLLSRSARSITAQEEIDDALYNYSYCNETVTINTVPIYYLEPNTIISAKDEQRVVNGYYIMNKITIPLTYNGTTSITAIKVPERIY